MVQYIKRAFAACKGWPRRTMWNTRLRGTEVVDLVEAEAARDDRFKWALGEIWIVAKDLPPDAVERIVIASGNAIYSVTSGLMPTSYTPFPEL